MLQTTTTSLLVSLLLHLLHLLHLITAVTGDVGASVGSCACAHRTAAAAARPRAHRTACRQSSQWGRLLHALAPASPARLLPRAAAQPASGWLARSLRAAAYLAMQPLPMRYSTAAAAALRARNTSWPPWVRAAGRVTVSRTGARIRVRGRGLQLLCRSAGPTVQSTRPLARPAPQDPRPPERQCGGQAAVSNAAARFWRRSGASLRD